MKIPLIKPDLPSYKEIEEQFREILENGKITNFGKYVTAFEEEAANYLGTKAITVSSGTIGLILALQSMGLRPGEKVILPSFTFMATAQAVLYAGGVPVFAEIDDDLTISISDLEVLLFKHKDVAIVLPVHMYGLPCRVDVIQQLVKNVNQEQSRSISILYDAAHAFGASINEIRVGSFGNAEVFSLSVTKLLVSAEGGLVSSRDSDLILRIGRMRNYGIGQNYNAYYPGLNAKMSEFHAIIGLYNLRRLDTLLGARMHRAKYYMEQIRTHTNFQTVDLPNNVQHTFKDFTILVPESMIEERDAVMNFLNERGIETRAYFYPAVHEQAFFRSFADRPLPRTENISRRVITLPFFTKITEAEIDYVVASLTEAQRRFS